MVVNTDFQKARYWQHAEKFTGLNGTWLGYVNELIKEIKYQLESTRENTVIYKVRERAMKLLQLIYNLWVNDVNKFYENEKILRYLDVIKTKPLTRVNPLDADMSDYLDSDIEADQNAGQHWIAEKPFRPVAEYLQNMIESSVSGPASDVLQNLGFDRDRNGYQSLKRLCEVFGRNAEHTACLPQNFIWGQQSLHADWAKYKNLIDGGLYLDTHKTNGPIVIACARSGFHHYQGAGELLNTIRMHLREENPKWVDFKVVVDRFLGDVVRERFNDAVQHNENGLAAMDISGIMPTNPNMTFEINNLQPLPKTPKPQNQKLKPILGRKNEFGEPKEGNAWWNRKTGKYQVNDQKMQPKPQSADKSSEKQQDKNYPSDSKNEKYKKKGKSKGK